MPIQEEFEKSGAWIFKWRSYLPLLMFILGIGAILDLKNSPITINTTPPSTSALPSSHVPVNLPM